MLEIFNNKQKRELGEWGQWGTLSAELFPGVPELSVSQSKINVNENYNCTCICKELLSLQNLSAGVKCQYLQISSVFYAAQYWVLFWLKTQGAGLLCSGSLLRLCWYSAQVFRLFLGWFFFFFFFAGGEVCFIPLPRRWLCIPEFCEGDGIQPESLLYISPASLLLLAAFKSF